MNYLKRLNNLNYLYPSLSNQSYTNSLNTIESISNLYKLTPTFITINADYEVVVEYFTDIRKISLYIQDAKVEYIKVWGVDIDNEMEDGIISSQAVLEDIFTWLLESASKDTSTL